MNNVHEFTPAEMIEIEASDWLAQMDGDQKLTQQELASLKQWMNRSPAHRAEINRQIKFWQQANVLTELSFPLPQKKNQENQFWSFSVFWQRMGVSVAALVAVFVIGFSMNIQTPSAVHISGNGVYETRIGEQNAITLIDGTVIELNTASRVQVDYTTQRRSIRLMQGEAFFTVNKDPHRVFEVAAGNGVVRAIGTAFAVRFNEQALTVSVTEGKVALAAVSSQASQTSQALQTSQSLPFTSNQADIADIGSLVAGQRAEFEPLLAHTLEDVTESISIDVIGKELAWRKGLLLFNGESLTNVVKEMNRYTKLTIEIADPSIADIQIGGQFKVGETEAMLENLAVSFGLDVYQVNQHLVQLKKNNRK
jgi:transmembrane sensor